MRDIIGAGCVKRIFVDTHLPMHLCQSVNALLLLFSHKKPKHKVNGQLWQEDIGRRAEILYLLLYHSHAGITCRLL